MPNKLTVHVWDPPSLQSNRPVVGHASFTLETPQGEYYVSFWPKPSRYELLDNITQEEAIHPPRKSVFNISLDADIRAERNKRPTHNIEIDVTEEQAQRMVAEITALKLEANAGNIGYTLVNQMPSKRGYNCSGIVEKVLSTGLGINFGNPEASTPDRVAETISDLQQENRPRARL